MALPSYFSLSLLLARSTPSLLSHKAYLTILSTITALLPTHIPCLCYTATTHRVNPVCTPPGYNRPCPVLDCIRATFITVPGYNPKCTFTPTVTSLLPCQTACPTGCALSTFTTTLGSGRCLPPTRTATISHSTRPCYTSTTTIKGHCPEDGLGCPPPDCIYLSK